MKFLMSVEMKPNSGQYFVTLILLRGDVNSTNSIPHFSKDKLKGSSKFKHT